VPRQFQKPSHRKPARSERKELQIGLSLVLGIFIALQLLDLLTTAFALTQSGFREANPLLAWLIPKYGLALTLIGIKALEIGAVSFITWAVVVFTPYSLTDDEAALGVLIFVNGLSILVLNNNFALIADLLPRFFPVIHP
jgi:uncharacterized protein DUF5658